MTTYNVTLQPSDEKISIEEGKSLLTTLREAGVYVKSSCGGVASCSDCIVKIVHGADNLNTPTFDETKLIGNVFHITRERLSCQIQASGDFTVDISGHDKTADATKLQEKAKKNSPKKNANRNIRRRSKDEVKAIYEERGDAKKAKEERMNSWQNHWQKEEDMKKSLGGGKRPKPFRTDHLDHVAEEEAKETEDTGKETPEPTEE
ncbi:MAG: (2Fe-2S)-binding protein [Halobacteriovoraceae bacterium]|nr:(2Fe-2S)-binding protein [Halobacteriovoraceae bacterium]